MKKKHHFFFFFFVPLALGLASWGCTFLYVRNHESARQIIQEEFGREKTSDDSPPPLQKRLREEIGAVEAYRQAAIISVILGLAVALLLELPAFHQGLSGGAESVRALAWLALVLALVQVLFRV